MNLSKIKKAHIIGVGGIGISAVAKLLIKNDVQVSGSDLKDSELIETLKSFGAVIAIGEHKAGNLPADCDLVIYSDAVPETNPERQAAQKKEIEQLSYFQFLGQFSEDKNSIVISSTHGKTTTTALTGLIFDNANLDPTVIVGSKVKNWDGNLRMGSSDYFIVEGDEYNAHMLELNPKTAIINNIEFEHSDYYKDLNHVVSTFQEFVNKIPEDGMLIYNLDDKVLNERIEKSHCNALSFSLQDQSADLYVRSIKIEHNRQIFKPVYKGQELKDFNLQVPGKFNVSNALAASLAALEHGIDPDVIKDTLAQFKGAWRRFENIGKISNLIAEKNGAIVISDYAHHPTEIASTIAAAKEFYPDKRLIAVFQPHQKRRTKDLFDDFVKTFAQSPADIVILSEIYDVTGREDLNQRISSRDLQDKIVEAEAKGLVEGIPVKTKYYYGKDLDDTKGEILNVVKSDDVVLIMGAGDIDTVARELV